jgi:hypothetical protein
VFLYLSSVVPAIWLLELDKVDRRIRVREEARNITAFSIEDLKGLDKIMGVSTDTQCLCAEQPTVTKDNP